jgi:thiamine biosynthesis lipoprotein
VSAKPRSVSLLRRTLGTLFIIVLFIAGWWYSQRHTEQAMMEIRGATMGTTYSVKVAPAPNDIDADVLKSELDAILAEINRQMSTYDPDSELSRFNRNESTDWVSVSPELAAVIREAQRISRLTDGVFDVTVGPLVNLWGFGPQLTDDRVPSDEAIAEALERVGYERLWVSGEAARVRKERADIYVDLSAIAKGYGVDRLAEHLESLGIENYLVEIGGELRAKGVKAQGQPWRVAVEKPSPGQRTIQRIVRVADRGIATSGDYRNFFERNGQRYSHAINPSTGQPVRHQLASVTVVDPSAMQADAMATALLVMGPEAGFELAEQQRLAAFFITINGDVFEEKATSQFGQFLAD